MTANEHQVGGDHYKTADGYQHWDLVADTGMGYLEGCATKYVSRWKKKGGVADLKKARHYVQKLAEGPDPGLITWFFANQKRESRRELAFLFTDVCNLGFSEHMIIDNLINWRCGHEFILHAMNELDNMIHEAEQSDEIPPAKPVPATEENHYAERTTPSGDGGKEETG